jgi:rSAM/selenodomain-associated transferase 2
MKLSVVVPALNEEDCLARALASVPAGAEIIVADGQSEDRTREIATELGARVVEGARGRGAQMNLGAKAASGDTLLFLHADCELGPEAGEAIRRALADARVVGGSFRLRISPARRGLAVVALGSNLRARLLGFPYGDQALFVRRSEFEAIGGYREIPIMEDVDLAKRLRSRGRMVSLHATVTTTPRHWERLGPLLTTLLNWVAVTAFFLGVPPTRLAPPYHRLRNGRPSEAPSREPLALPNE